MIDVWVSEEVFRYDADSLVKAFFPGIPVKNHLLENISNDILCVRIEGETLETTVIEIENADTLSKSELRNILKRKIYIELSGATGRTLPWGTLTGVRPVRLASKLIREIEDGAEEEAGARESREERKTVALADMQTASERAIAALQNLYFVSAEKAGLAVEIALRQREVISRLYPGYRAGDALPGYSLYVGIPFCPSRCAYCSFASYPIALWQDRVGEYLSALGKELDFVREAYGNKSPDTLYIGGGTPTALNEGDLEMLLDMIESKINVTNVIEYTLEAGRPDSITEAKLIIMKRHGITRMCVNPQTMNEETLERIGRHHSANNIRDAYAMAREAGFENINMDVILGLPGEGYEEVSYTLEEIAKLQPDDLTVHSLAIKRGSAFKEELDEVSASVKSQGLHNSNSANNFSPQQLPANPNTATNATAATSDIMALARGSAKAMGLKPYYLYRQKNISGNFENTGYARPGREGLYNIVIMEEIQSLIACGAGTVSKYVSPDGKHIARCDTPKDIEQYLSRIDEMVERKRELFNSCNSADW